MYGLSRISLSAVSCSCYILSCSAPAAAAVVGRQECVNHVGGKTEVFCSWSVCYKIIHRQHVCFRVCFSSSSLYNALILEMYAQAAKYKGKWSYLQLSQLPLGKLAMLQQPMHDAISPPAPCSPSRALHAQPSAQVESTHFFPRGLLGHDIRTSSVRPAFCGPVSVLQGVYVYLYTLGSEYCCVWI